MKKWVKDAISEGAQLICGGSRISSSCYEPTILFSPAAQSQVSTSEIFGPVVCITPYQELNGAICQANDIDYHFQSAVYTNDLNTMLTCVNHLNATAVMVNDHTAFRADWMPFAGRDASGLGTGGIEHSIQEMLREKMMVIKSDKL